MGIKVIAAKLFAAYISYKIKKDSSHALLQQELWFNKIIRKSSATKFGIDHKFHEIKTYNDFKINVPINDYEGIKRYINCALNGEKNVLWPGKPLYWAKTSGTTSGVKFIPITKDSIPFHINSARNALLCYIHETGNADFINGKLIFLSGSPAMEKVNGVFTGRLSGIVNHHVPKYLRSNQLPSYKTNCIDDWEQKITKITEETVNENLTLISGIPPWVQMYFDKLIALTGKKIKDIFPNFNLFVYGGVNFEPYRAKLEQSIGKKVDSIETYPASEGFIAMQDSRSEKGLLLLTNNGIFYEFIPVDEFYNATPSRISLKDILLDVNYVLILTTNAGLYAYNIGDTIRFVSKKPYRILVTGRVKHFISAFGEHVIGEEVDEAITHISLLFNVNIIEFTLAPQINPPEGGLPYHEWFIAFDSPPGDIKSFANQLDTALQEKNIYYKDLIEGAILKPLVIRLLAPSAFINYMRNEGKLGGQNKVPRLSNDRSIADLLSPHING